MVGTNGGTPAGAAVTTEADDQEQSLAEILERLRREPALRSWVLGAPTGALASLGITLDDHEISALLDQVEEMDHRPLPVTAQDIMSTEPITVTPQTTIHEAAELLAEHRISGLPVCDYRDALVGVLSEYDLIARSGKTVGDIMSRDVVSVPTSATLETVRALFVSRRLKRVPVVGEDGRLAGLISRADLVRELAYRWACTRCGYVVRAKRAPEGCPKCGSARPFEAAQPEPAVSACPTCGRPLEH
ncbi:MAG: CBS domain-containing protein [Chloroflexi bacterium]|nr:CBS domain-containing protein [Chloroflexota bacterium]